MNDEQQNSPENDEQHSDQPKNEVMILDGVIVANEPEAGEPPAAEFHPNEAPPPAPEEKPEVVSDAKGMKAGNFVLYHSPSRHQYYPALVVDVNEDGTLRLAAFVHDHIAFVPSVAKHKDEFGTWKLLNENPK